MPEKYFNSEERLLNMQEVARYFHVSRNIFMNLVKTELIPHVVIGKRIKFIPEEIQKWLRQRRIPKIEEQ